MNPCRHQRPLRSDGSSSGIGFRRLKKLHQPGTTGVQVGWYQEFLKISDITALPEVDFNLWMGVYYRCWWC
jgi:hypothetical protein